MNRPDPDQMSIGAALRRLERAVAHVSGAGVPDFPESQTDATNTMALQLLYERWVGRPRWELRTEAVPLMIGVDPDRWPRLLAVASVASAEATVWDRLSAAAARREFDHDTNTGPPDAWRAAPQALYQWVQGQAYQVPHAWDTLMQFVMKVVKRDPAAARAPGTGAAYSSTAPRHVAGERVLGAALNVVSKWPDQVRDQHGFIDAAKVLDRIERSTRLYFDSDALPLDRAQARALIERWLT